MNIAKFVAIASAAGFAATSAMASSDYFDISGPNTTLQDVIDNGGQFRVGDKLFTVMDYFSVEFSAAAIGINPIDFGNFGRGFALTDAWVDGTPGDTVAFDFNLQYMVEIVDDPTTRDINEATDPNWLIVDNRLIFDGFATVPGSFARVEETVIDPTGAFVGEKSVFANGDGTEQFEDVLNFQPGYKKLFIDKNAEFFSVAGGTSGASFIEQTFSQVPTPGTALLGTAGLLLASRRRR